MRPLPLRSNAEARTRLCESVTVLRSAGTANCVLKVVVLPNRKPSSSTGCGGTHPVSRASSFPVTGPCSSPRVNDMVASPLATTPGAGRGIPIGPASFFSSVGASVIVSVGIVTMFCTVARTGADAGSVAPNPIVTVAASPAHAAPTLPTSMPATTA
jgi:hypothetical protein